MFETQMHLWNEVALRSAKRSKLVIFQQSLFFYSSNYLVNWVFWCLNSFNPPLSPGKLPHVREVKMNPFLFDFFPSLDLCSYSRIWTFTILISSELFNYVEKFSFPVCFLLWTLIIDSLKVKIKHSS